MSEKKNVLQITLKKQKVRKTKLGRFFQRLGFKIHDTKTKFEAWFYGSIVKLMRWLAPKEVVEKWDAEWEEEMKDATIQVVSELSNDERLREEIQKGIDSGIAEDFNSEEKEILKDFAEKMMKNSKDLDPEIAKIIDENFWEMLNEENKNNGKKTSNN